MYNTGKQRGHSSHLARLYRSMLGGLALIILVILTSCAANGTTPGTGGTTTTPGNPGASATATAPGTSPGITPINATVTYASDMITILNVQQSQSFADDSSSGTNGVLRLNIQEKTGATAPSYAYSSVVNLILSSGNTVSLANALQSTSPDAGVSRTNWLDFALPTNTNVGELTLRLGTDAEAQMNIPLKANAELSQYQTKTISPNTTLQYKGLNWTITSAALSWSAVGKQAAKGMRYVTVTLKIDNPSPNEFIAYWGDYIRLKSSSATSAPDSSTLGTSFAAGSTGTKGDVVFIMPDNSTSFTLLLGNTSNGETQVPGNFQFQ